jgi:hypothetical protein
MSVMRSELQQKAQGALIQYAIFRWETALIVALTIVLTFLLPHPFPFWPWFGWPLLGVIAVVVLVYSSITDVDANAQVLLKLYQQQFDTTQIKDKDLRIKVDTALEYQRRIELQIRQQDSGMIRDRLEDTANQVTDWISNVYALALRLDAYRGDDLLARQRTALPQELQKLEAQRKLEPNGALQEQLDGVIASKQRQLQALQQLDSRMRQALLQLDNSLTALATVYSQIHLIDAQSVGSGRAERLQADIQEQVASLNDLVSSINDVYDYSTKGLG